MKKIIQEKIEEYSCDNCKKHLGYITYLLECGYGSDLDTNTFYFCSIKCLKEFIKEIKE